jgi:(S)-mandelate dehydrogenase
LHGCRDFRRALCIEDLRGIARRRLPNFAFEFMEGGAEDEKTLAWNRQAFESYRLLPATLVDTRGRSIAATLLGQAAAAPLVVAPTGINGIYARDADLALARAAAAAKIPFCLSTVSNQRLEMVAAEAGGRLWLQLYVMKNRDIARDLIARAEAAGCEALMLTSDANVFGHREWDKRNYRAPGELSWRNLLDVALHPRWIRDVLLPDGLPRFENIARYMPPEARSARGGVAFIPQQFAPDLSWNELAWIRRQWPRKLILKGVLSAADARRAADAGCEAIVLSNHGGRQLDSCVSPMDQLPEVVAAVGGRSEIYVDSGFRRGSEIVKAIALGARAVLVGRATLYGLAAGGQQGVQQALQILASETDRTLGQLGCNGLDELGPAQLRRIDGRSE